MIGITTNMLKLGDRLKCWQPISKVFFILFFVYHWKFSEMQCVCTREEHWTGLGLNWIQTMTNFV